jgi:glycopeptide antibiotics resistance protein
MTKNRISRRSETIFLVLALFIILMVTLFPYLPGHPSVTPDGHPHRLGWYWNFNNLLANVLLFAPLGFGLSHMAGNRGLSLWARTVLCIGVGLGLSAAVEWFQVLLPSRSPSFFDLAANTAGSGIGLIIHQARGPEILRIASSLSSRMAKRGKWFLAVTALVYVALVIGMVTNSRRLTSLTSWDDSSILILGNEHTANRPWRGWMKNLAIGEQAMSTAEVEQYFETLDTVGIEDGLLPDAYNFTSDVDPGDRSGLLPDLTWRRSESTPNPGNEERDSSLEGGVRFSAEQWLESPLPATSLTQRLKRSGQFTLATVIASLDSSQTGPARIVSLSLDPYNRNFTLGQTNCDLIVRLRNGLTGDNGSRPELVVPGILGTKEPRHLVMTYNGGIQRVYVDGIHQQYVLDLRYAAMLSVINFRFDERDLFGYKVIIIFIVLGPWILLGLVLIVRLFRRTIKPGLSRFLNDK